MKTTKINEEVLFATDAIVKIDASDIAELKQKAKQNPRRRIRICVHSDIRDSIHEMLIVHSFGQYIQPHINLVSAKSFVVLDGEMVVVLFNNEGEISNYVQLGESNGASAFLLRLDDPVFHTVVPISTTVTFLETVKGPHVQTHIHHLLHWQGHC